MKKNIITAAMLSLAIMGLSSCADKEEVAVTAPQNKEITLSASVAVECGDKGLSKAVLQSDMQTIYFSPKEEALVIFFADKDDLLSTEVFVSDNTVAAASATFKGSVSQDVADAAEAYAAMIPASVFKEGSVSIPTTQTPIEDGFDSEAFIASTDYESIDNTNLTFTPECVLLKMTSTVDGDITVEGKGIAGDYENPEDKITVKGLKFGKTYFVSVLEGNYDKITVKDSKGNILKETGSTVFLEDGKYYTIKLGQPISYVTYKVGDVEFQMAEVVGGTFTMGATTEQGSLAEDDEKPAHSVTLSNYQIGKFEVTQGLWKAVMGNTNNPSGFKYDDNLPLENINWNKVKNTFLTKLNEATGKNFRLPTEAEWEFAARGGINSKGYIYSGSNKVEDVAWYDENAKKPYDNNEITYPTHVVGSKLPNELGIYDMSGNVWELCEDYYGAYSSESQTNPQGPTSGSSRIMRGGCWDYSSNGARVSNRLDVYAVDGGKWLGFRLALSIE